MHNPATYSRAPEHRSAANLLTGHFLRYRYLKAWEKHCQRITVYSRVGECGASLRSDFRPVCLNSRRKRVDVGRIDHDRSNLIDVERYLHLSRR